MNRSLQLEFTRLGVREEMMPRTMAWLYLIIAGLFEVAWAIGLKYTDGFSRVWPSVLTILAMIISFGFLAQALKTIPVGTGYAVWTGIGAVGTATSGDSSLFGVSLMDSAGFHRPDSCWNHRIESDIVERGELSSLVRSIWFRDVLQPLCCCVQRTCPETRRGPPSFSRATNTTLRVTMTAAIEQYREGSRIRGSQRSRSLQPGQRPLQE